MISSLGMAVVTVASDGLFDGKLVCLRGSPRTLATNFYFYFIYPVGVSFCFCSMASKNLFVSLFSSSFLPCEFLFRPHIAQKVRESRLFFVVINSRVNFLLLFAVFSMSTNVSAATTSFEKLAKAFDRKNCYKSWICLFVALASAI